MWNENVTYPSVNPHLSLHPINPSPSGPFVWLVSRKICEEKKNTTFLLNNFYPDRMLGPFHTDFRHYSIITWKQHYSNIKLSSIKLILNKSKVNKGGAQFFSSGSPFTSLWLLNVSTPCSAHWIYCDINAISIFKSLAWVLVLKGH